jgi:tetratricopeptide (TPR) repeat protein
MAISLYRTSIAAGIVLLCGLCAWRSVKLAVGITPDSAEYHLAAGDPDLAVRLNPRYAAAWIARGLEAETTGDREKAEASLKRAAEVDLTYLPRWTLASFYLRAGDLPAFWIWARRAAYMAYSPAALFQLCWRASSDAREILERAIPPEPAARRSYFDFLVGANRLEAAERLAEELERTADASDLNRLLAFCDVELARKQVRPARQAWNALAAGQLVPQSTPLTNGGLATAPVRHCFDWLPNPVEGAAFSFDTAAHEMNLSVSGKQPEQCDFVEQYVAVEPGAAYRFRFRARTALAGLHWGFRDARTSGEFSSGVVSRSPGWSEQTFAFSVPTGCELLRIMLVYRRPAGSVRVEGEAVFTGFTLERAG